MIDLYASPTPNVLKVEIMLEEIGLPYRLLPINVWKGDQFADDFKALNPNSKVPVIVDHDAEGGPCPVFESAAILIYLAEKTGGFLPAAGRARTQVFQWLVFQAANQGPASGQLVHFQRYAGPGNDYSLSRYKTEVLRLYGVLETRLSAAPWLAGEAYSIADMATLPWVLLFDRMFSEAIPFLKVDAARGPALARWVASCLERPAVSRAIELHAALKSGLPTATDEDKDRFFGRGKYAAQ
jgi:GST-like protein